MNCKKYVKKALFQKNTWLKSIPSYLKYYHVIGDETLDRDFVFDDVSQVLWVKTPDDYNSLPKKVIEAYNAVHATFDYKYIFKTDDDQILVNSNFFNTITKLITNKTPISHYGGYIVDIPESHLSQYHKIHPELPKNLPLYATKYCSGRFYFLSNDATADLLTKTDLIKKEYFEDYAIGYNLHEKYKIDMLNILTNKIFTDIELSDFPQLVKKNKI
uniref:Hexosyltransferase n=1 Tax=viral metagenome TaxID=1070528 RepID=A0A6C0JHF4_9ZZZZ